MSYVPIEGYYIGPLVEKLPPPKSPLEVLRSWVSSFIMPTEAPLCMSTYASHPSSPLPHTVQVEQVEV